jgi:hypothetical protein
MLRLAAWSFRRLAGVRDNTWTAGLLSRRVGHVARWANHRTPNVLL